MKKLDDWREKLGFESRGYPPMRIVQKPWGHEEIWAETTNYVGKVLVINPGHRLSRQYHNLKEETFRVLSGILSLEIGQGADIVTHNLVPGEAFHCPPGTIHRMICEPILNVEAVQVLEVSTNHLDDVVRLEDDYKR
jgi:quercetin dioxygenase-like cupin family protein